MSPEGEHLRDEGTNRGILERFREYPWLPGDRDLDFAPSDFRVRVQSSSMLARLCELARSATTVPGG